MVKSASKKIGIMGGTFDPVHTGHLVIAEKAREEFCLNKILFIPSGIPPHGKRTFVPAEQRFEMVRIAVAGNRYFEVCDIEIKRDKPSYTYDTISLIEIENPDTEIYFITGEDAFCDLLTWHRYRSLVRKTVFLVAPRLKKGPRRIPEIPFLRYRFINSPLMEISSSRIRNCFLEGKTVKYLVPDRVIEYARRHGLYGL